MVDCFNGYRSSVLQAEKVLEVCCRQLAILQLKNGPWYVLLHVFTIKKPTCSVKCFHNKKTYCVLDNYQDG